MQATYNPIAFCRHLSIRAGLAMMFLLSFLGEHTDKFKAPFCVVCH